MANLIRPFASALRQSQRLGAGRTRWFHPSTSVCSDAINLHRDKQFNNSDTPFDFTPENYKHIEWVLNKYPSNYKQSAVIALLDLAQRQNDNWIPLSAMNKIAKILDMAPIRVYEVATFYTMFNREPIGKYNVQVCTTTPCMVRGGYDVLEACKEELGVGLGGSTPDGLFHLMEVECLGACVNAPMMQINDHFYEDLDKDSTKDVLRQLREGKQPKIGPANSRRNCEPFGGKTTLLEDPPGPYCRPLTKPKEKEAAK